MFVWIISIYMFTSVWPVDNPDIHVTSCTKFFYFKYQLQRRRSQGIICIMSLSWWHHKMETFSAFLAICAANSPVTGEFLTQRPLTWSFDVFSDLRLNKHGGGKIPFLKNMTYTTTFDFINPSRAKSYHKNISTISISPPHWHDRGSRNPFSCQTRTYLFYLINIMGVDVLGTQGGRASAVMIVIMLNRIIRCPRFTGLNDKKIEVSVF